MPLKTPPPNYGFSAIRDKLSQFGKNDSDRTANLWAKFEDGSQRRFKPLVLGRVRAELPSFFKEQGAFPNNPTGWDVSRHGLWVRPIASENLRFARNWYS